MRWSRAPLVLLAAGCLGATGCGGDDDAGAATTTPHGDGTAHAGDEIDPDALTTVMRATAGFQDVDVADAAGYESTLDALGCFHDAELGGMGLHYLNEALLDDELDPAAPEALVYELDSDGEIAGLVGLEYIVPVDAWSHDEPPSVLGMDLHEHRTLPLWVLHAWVWKDNPAGVFQDFNPAVRSCPDGVPVFGVDLP